MKTRKILEYLEESIYLQKDDLDMLLKWGDLTKHRSEVSQDIFFSFKGLIDTITAPRFFACSSDVSILGWLVPGFCPKINIKSACLKSSRVTEPLPVPRVSVRAVPLDS